MTNYQYLANCDFKELLFFVCENSCCSCCKDRNKKCSNCKKKRKKICLLVKEIDEIGITFEQYFRKSGSKEMAQFLAHLSFCGGCGKCTPFEEHKECWYYPFVCSIEGYLNKEKTRKGPLL